MSKLQWECYPFPEGSPHAELELLVGMPCIEVKVKGQCGCCTYFSRVVIDGQEPIHEVVAELTASITDRKEDCLGRQTTA